MRSLRRLIGRGRRWWRGVDGAAGMREVTVDASAAWASCSWSSMATILGGSQLSPAVSGRPHRFVQCAGGGLVDGLAVAVLDSLCSPVCVQ
jgi:hypothetical protein